jgi:hypothetical protein
MAAEAQMQEFLAGHTATTPRFTWQVQASDYDVSWTDLGPIETALLEAAWTRQLWSTSEISIVMTGLPGWRNHVFYLGSRLHQINTITGRARMMRRILVIEEGRAGGWAMQPEQQDPSSGSEGF